MTAAGGPLLVNMSWGMLFLDAATAKLGKIKSREVSFVQHPYQRVERMYDTRTAAKALALTSL